MSARGLAENRFSERIVDAAIKWEDARAKSTLLNASETDFARMHRAAQRLATAVRVYRRKHQ